MDPNITAATIALLKTAQSQPLEKSTFAQSATATSGMTYYDLELGAKKLFPVITPLRNTLPRVSGKGGIQANWRAITAINGGNVSLGVSGGNRGGVIAVTTTDYIAAYRGLGLEANVDFEAEYAGETFDDVRALAAMTLLESVMIGEEKMILGGNSSLSLGTTGTPTLAGSNSGGSLATAGAYSVICVALSYDGYLSGSVAGGILASVARTNADGSSDTFGGGSAQKSANATVGFTGPNGSVTATVTAVRGAVGYAWFWAATAGSEILGAITTINSVLITATATGTQTAASLPSSDNSKNTLAFDGFLTHVYTSANNAYFKSLATGTAGTGTPLTADTAGGIVEIDAALQSFWDVSRLSPSEIWVNSQEQTNISKKILTGTTAAAQRFVFQTDPSAIGGGVMVASYRNKYSMDGAKEIPIKLHPNMPPGTILFRTVKLPYPLSNVQNVAQIRARREYYQIEWPLRSRKYEYGVYVDQVLQNYFPPSFGVITNIGNG